MGGKRVDGPFFELSFAPSLEVVANVRELIGSVFRRYLDEDSTSRLALAAHELLENAVRYCHAGKPRVRVELAPVSAGRLTVTIDTWNASKPEHIASLAALLADLAGASDIGAFYQTLMPRSVTRIGGSGLGLGRIRAEAEMELRHTVEEDRVNLRAEGRFDGVRVSA